LPRRCWVPASMGSFAPLRMTVEGRSKLGGLPRLAFVLAMAGTALAWLAFVILSEGIASLREAIRSRRTPCPLAVMAP
jgi:hypothetical protein